MGQKLRSVRPVSAAGSPRRPDPPAGCPVPLRAAKAEQRTEPTPSNSAPRHARIQASLCKWLSPPAAHVSPLDCLSARVRDPHPGDLDTPSARRFAPHCHESVAKKAGKQLDSEPMGHQRCLCEAVRRVGEYPKCAAPFRTKDWLSRCHGHCASIGLTAGAIPDTTCTAAPTPMLAGDGRLSRYRLRGTSRSRGSARQAKTCPRRRPLGLSATTTFRGRRRVPDSSARLPGVPQRAAWSSPPNPFKIQLTRRKYNQRGQQEDKFVMRSIGGLPTRNARHGPRSQALRAFSVT